MVYLSVVEEYYELRAFLLAFFDEIWTVLENYW
jgi:hypothetical protein